MSTSTRRAAPGARRAAPSLHPPSLHHSSRKVSMKNLRLIPLFTRLLRQERGAATAEYGIVIMAAVGFAGLLVVILRSDEVRGMLTDLVRNALAFGG